MARAAVGRGTTRIPSHGDGQALSPSPASGPGLGNSEPGCPCRLVQPPSELQ